MLRRVEHSLLLRVADFQHLWASIHAVRPASPSDCALQSFRRAFAGPRALLQSSTFVLKRYLSYMLRD